MNLLVFACSSGTDLELGCPLFLMYDGWRCTKHTGNATAIVRCVRCFPFNSTGDGSKHKGNKVVIAKHRLPVRHNNVTLVNVTTLYCALGYHYHHAVSC